MRGCDVVVADASAAMLGIATRRLEDAGARFRAVHSRWEDLPAHLPAGAFDAIVCTGNAISHLYGEAAMITAFQAFAELLAPGGMLILDTHEWEDICAAGSRRVVDHRVIVRGGRRCTRRYVWHMPPEVADAVVLELEFDLADEAGGSTRTHRLEMYPFTRQDLRTRLALAGFCRIALDSIPGHDRYTATAHTPCGRSVG